MLRVAGEPASEICSDSLGSHFLTVSSSRQVQLWNVGTGVAVKVMLPDCDLAAISPNGLRVGTGTFRYNAQNGVSIWDAESGRKMTSLDLPPDYQDTASFVFSPDGSSVTSASFRNRDQYEVVTWDAVRGRQLGVFEGHHKRVNALAFSPDGKRVLTASSDWTARIVDATKCTELAVLQHSLMVSNVCYSADGSRIATVASDGVVRIWDATELQEIRIWGPASPVNNRTIPSVVFSPDGTRT